MNFGFSYIGLIFLIISTIVLGIGHIGIHLNHKKGAELKDERNV